jgi:hypothetical protein
VSTSESTPVNVAPVEAPKALSQQFFDAALPRRAQARDLRSQTPSRTVEADTLDAEAAKLEDKALEIATQSEIKRESVKFEKWLKEQEHFLAWRLENVRSVISLSQSAIRVVATANAGAAVALLAFLGNALAKDAHLVAARFAAPILTFAIGVVLAVLVGGASYLTQFLYGSDDPKMVVVAKRVHWFTAALWLVATGAFAVGCFETYSAVRSMTKSEGAPVATNDTNRSSAGTLQRNTPPPTRPAAEPPVVQLPVQTPATQPATRPAGSP